MSCIPLTTQQKQALADELLSLENRIAKYEEIEPRRIATVLEQERIDNSFKAAFDFYDGIVKAYEDEREAMDGQYVDSPVVEQDIINPANIVLSRTTPQNPANNVIRIAQFDGSPLITTDNDILGFQSDAGATVVSSEQYWISKQAEMEDWLVNGFGGTAPTFSGDEELLTAIDPTTTIIELEDPSFTAEFAVGDTFVLTNATEQVGILVKAIINQDIPNGEYELEIANLTSGSMSAGAVAIDVNWAGFDNADRIAKVDSTDGYDDLLADMIMLLELSINNRLDKLSDQITAFDLNSDPDKDLAAKTNMNTSSNFLTNYLITTDISDVGLGTLATERGVRSPQITARIAAITAAYTGQPIGNFFDLRYGFANDRGNTSRGTLRVLLFEQKTDAVIAGIKANAEAKIIAINNMLDIACP